MNEPNKIRIRAALRCHMRGIDEGIARSASFISRAAGDFLVPERPILMIFTAFLGSGKRAPSKAQGASACAQHKAVRPVHKYKSCIMYWIWKRRVPAKMTYTRFDRFRCGPAHATLTQWRLDCSVACCAVHSSEDQYDTRASSVVLIHDRHPAADHRGA